MFNDGNGDAVERRKMVHLLEDLQEHQQTKTRSLAPG